MTPTTSPADLLRLIADVLKRTRESEPYDTFTQFEDDLRTEAARLSETGTGGEFHKLDTPTQVFFYEQDFYVLSNFSAFKVHWRGIDFDTSEHAYHWERFDGNEDMQNGVRYASSAHEAFKFAQRYKAAQRPNWDGIKCEIMRAILWEKADQHEYVRRKLLATGDRELIEDSWRDDFWGWGQNRDGKNMLGKCWMEVRAKLRNTPAPETAATAATAPKRENVTCINCGRVHFIARPEEFIAFDEKLHTVCSVCGHGSFRPTKDYDAPRGVTLQPVVLRTDTTPSPLPADTAERVGADVEAQGAAIGGQVEKASAEKQPISSTSASQAPDAAPGLLPCPFCKEELVKRDRSAFHPENDCWLGSAGDFGGGYEISEHLYRAWNTRPVTPAQPVEAGIDRELELLRKLEAAANRAATAIAELDTLQSRLTEAEADNRAKQAVIERWWEADAKSQATVTQLRADVETWAAAAKHHEAAAETAEASLKKARTTITNAAEAMRSRTKDDMVRSTATGHAGEAFILKKNAEYLKDMADGLLATQSPSVLSADKEGAET